MSPPKRTWTDEEIVAELTQNPRDLRATLGFLDRYVGRLHAQTMPIVGASVKVEQAIQKGVAGAFVRLTEKPPATPLFAWVWERVEQEAQRLASFPL